MHEEFCNPIYFRELRSTVRTKEERELDSRTPKRVAIMFSGCKEQALYWMRRDMAMKRIFCSASVTAIGE